MRDAEAKASAPAVKNREQEWKRARGAIACAECRRLKLKCDKTVPCTSCKRRGCAPICPNGSLVTGQGTRFVLASTDRLHLKISQMSDRIRVLEEALSVAHLSASPGEQHPLLAHELMKIKSIIELHGAAEGEEGEGHQGEGEEGEDAERLDIFGTLAVSEDGASMFYGRSAGQESLLLTETDPLSMFDAAAALPSLDTSTTSTLPASIEALSASLPLSAPATTTMHTLAALAAHFPPWPRAKALCAHYLAQAPWFFGAVKARQIWEELIPTFYPTPAEEAAPHDLALLFIVFCFGALTDPALPPAPHNHEAEEWYTLTRAALAVEPVMERAPSVSTVQTLAMVGIYQGLVAGEGSIEATWAWMGMSTKLAQSIGLHRDCARWKLPPAEVQKRRALFWELFITDCWQSLATGRLATFALPFIDCELPQDQEQTMAADGTPQPSFPHWKAQFGKTCVSEVVRGILTARAPKYSVILELDRRVRDMELPRYATEPPPRGAGFDVTMSCYMPVNYRCLTLVYIHRAFFAQGLCDQPADPLKSSYALSVSAGYRSACELLSSVREQFAFAPEQIARFWVLWTHAFSSAVMLALVPVRAPKSKLAQTALMELKGACDLFEQAAVHGGRAVKMLPVVRRHLEKATHSFHTARTPLLKGPGAGDAEFFPAPARDEFSVFQGVTHTVATKAKARARPPALSPSSSSAGGTSISGGASSGSASERMSVSASGSSVSSVAPPSAYGPVSSGVATDSNVTEHTQLFQQGWGDVPHAMLVDQLMTFEGTLDAQISGSDAALQSGGGYGYGAEGDYAECETAGQYAYAGQEASWQERSQRGYEIPPPSTHPQHPQVVPHQEHYQRPPSSHHEPYHKPPPQHEQYAHHEPYQPPPPSHSEQYAHPHPSSPPETQHYAPPAAYAPHVAHYPMPDVAPAAYSDGYSPGTNTTPSSHSDSPGEVHSRPYHQPSPPYHTPYPHHPMQNAYPYPDPPSHHHPYLDALPQPYPDPPPHPHPDSRHPNPYPDSHAHPAQQQLWDPQKLWAVPHTDAAPRRASVSERARDRVLRQSGDLSLTEAWSAFMSQMDVPVPGAGAARSR